MEQILIIDQGTHASRCLVFSTDGEVLAEAQYPVNLYRQAGGFIEQNAEKILASIYYCIEAIQQQVDLSKISCAGLVTQRSTIVAWQKDSGKTLSAAISWQDTRAQAYLSALLDDTNDIKQITGLPLSAHYSASKIKWLIENDENCKATYQQHEIIIAPLASYLVAHLTDDFTARVDHINAARTLLFDINKLNWSQTMLDRFDIANDCLAKPQACLSDFGTLRRLPIPLQLVTGDQNSALFTNGVPTAEQLIINLGTGGFVLALTDNLAPPSALLNGLAITTSEAYSPALGQTTYYLQEGTVNGAGAALSLLFNEMDETSLFNSLADWLTTIEKPLIYINSNNGLGSPWWSTAVPAHYINEQGHEVFTDIALADRAVATIESIVFLLQNNIELLKDNKQHIVITGGLSRLDGLCQKLADLSQLPVYRNEQKEASARGAAWLLSQTLVLKNNWQKQTANRQFTPKHNKNLTLRYQAFTNRLTSLTSDQKTLSAVD